MRWVNKGDFIEYLDIINNKPIYTIRIIALFSEEKGRIIEAFYTKKGASTISDIEREQLRNTIITVHLNP